MLDFIIVIAALFLLYFLINWLIKIDDKEACETCSNYHKREDMEIVGGDVFYSEYSCKSCMDKSNKK